MKNVLSKIVVLMVILMALLAGSVKARKNSGFWGDSGIIIVSYGTPDIEVKNLALKIRDVPIHKDDGYARECNIGPIDQKGFKPSGTLMLTPQVGRKNITKTLRTGLKLGWILYPSYNFNHALRNYTNAPGTETRGYGAALTFVGIEKRGIIPSMGFAILDILLNIYPEVFLEKALLKKKEWNNWFIGSSLGYYKFQAVNGWDRYNNLEIKDTYALAYVVPIGVYIRHKSVEIGIKYPIVKKTEIGKESDIKIIPSAYIAFYEPPW